MFSRDDSMGRKILVMELPGAGKTTLAKTLVPLLNAVHFNADAVRANVNKDLGFSLEDRVEQARAWAGSATAWSRPAPSPSPISSAPPPKTRAAFGEAFVVWVDRVDESCFADTNRMFVPPARFDVRVTAEGTPAYWAQRVHERLLPTFNAKAPTALFIGRYQPFHDGHRRLIEEGMKRVGQVCIAVRDTQGTDEKNPFDFQTVRARIESALWQHRGRFVVVPARSFASLRMTL